MAPSGPPVMSSPADQPGAGSVSSLLARLGQDRDRLAPRKRSVRIRGHATSFSLEEPFWQALKRLAAAEGLSLAELVARVDEARGPLNLSAALRVVVLWAQAGLSPTADPDFREPTGGHRR